MPCHRCGNEIPGKLPHTCLPAAVAARKSLGLKQLMWGGVALAVAWPSLVIGFIPALLAWILLASGSHLWTLAMLPCPSHPVVRWALGSLLGLAAILGSGLLVLITCGAGFGVGPRTTLSVFGEFFGSFFEYLKIRS
jgi:hypothetical protein